MNGQGKNGRSPEPTAGSGEPDHVHRVGVEGAHLSPAVP